MLDKTWYGLSVWSCPNEIKANHMITIAGRKIPGDLVESLRDFNDFFKKLKIKFWVGGGLLQKIHNHECREISNNWQNSLHDIDFFCMIKDKAKIESSDFLAKKGYQRCGDYVYKTRYSLNGKPLEIIYFQESSLDDDIIYYLGHGKKELWLTICKDLSDPRRRHKYIHSFPKEILETEKIKCGNIILPALNKLYIQLCYPKYREL